MKQPLDAYQIIELLGTDADQEYAWKDFDEDVYDPALECREHEIALKIVESLKADLEAYFDKQRNK